MQYLSVVSGWFGLAAPWGTFIGFLRRLSGRVSHSSHSIKVCANLSVQRDGGRGGGRGVKQKPVERRDSL